ncbi:metalloprotease, partial [Basidiobolus ranarum]
MSEHHNISLPEVIDSSDKLTNSAETTTSNIDVSPSAIKGYKILANKIEKSDTDDRSYRMIELDNGLKAMLIHDPETDHGSAALDVHVGHLSDPENLQGLAHFCEHLLFMGTEKYPVENDYNQYLSEHGGDSNAFTSLDNTNYFFEVRHEHFEGALDRFAQFFISPLFSPSCTEREIKAVDSENKKNLQSDNWRIFQLEKSLSNPKHPYCHFGTGNLQTLWDGPIEQGLDVRAELLKFHAKYYSSNIMKLVVLGRESLDKLTDWVVNKFSPIQNKSIAVPEFPGSPLTPLELQKQVKIRPVKDIRTLELAFPFPDQYPMYKVQPGRYLSHLIGHEGAGSILSLLKKKGWANYLSAGASHGGIGFEFFKISVDLTEEGLNHTDEIVRIVFQYIEMMKRVGVQEWIFREVENLASMSFRFKEKTPPSSYTSRVATLMQRPYPAEWVLSGPYLIRDYDPKCIEECLAWLRPDNFRIFLISQSFDPKGMETEKWYGTNYQVMEFSEGFKEELRKLTLNSELKFPKPNPFIPTDFDTHKVPGKEILKRPALICNNGTSRVWHKKDDTFWVPKVNMWFFFRTPLAYDTPSSCVKTRMFTELLRDSLTEYSYDAEVAGINYSLENETEGISLEIDGYNDKIGILLEAIVQRMKAFE